MIAAEKNESELSEVEEVRNKAAEVETGNTSGLESWKSSVPMTGLGGHLNSVPLL